MSNKFMKLTDMNLEHVVRTSALTPTIEEVKRRMAEFHDEPYIGGTRGDGYERSQNRYSTY